MKVVEKTSSVIAVSSGRVVASASGLDKPGSDPAIMIMNQLDRSRSDTLSVIALDRSRLDDIIKALQGLRSELAAFPVTVKQYVEERNLGGGHWRDEEIGAMMIEQEIGEMPDDADIFIDAACVECGLLIQDSGRCDGCGLVYNG